MNRPYEIQNAWNKFAQNGSVEAYLRYCSVRHSAETESREDENNAVADRRPDYKNPEYR